MIVSRAETPLRFTVFDLVLRLFYLAEVYLIIAQ